MKVSFEELENVIKCIEEVMPNTKVRIDFCRSDGGSRLHHEDVEVSIRDEGNDATLFSAWGYSNIFQAYPILLGIYYGMSIAKGKPFDYSPTPAGSDWE